MFWLVASADAVASSRYENIWLAVRRQVNLNEWRWSTQAYPPGHAGKQIFFSTNLYGSTGATRRQQPVLPTTSSSISHIKLVPVINQPVVFSLTENQHQQSSSTIRKDWGVDTQIHTLGRSVPSHAPSTVSMKNPFGPFLHVLIKILVCSSHEPMNNAICFQHSCCNSYILEPEGIV